MSSELKNKMPDILFSCYTEKNSEGEQFVPAHAFGVTLSGRSDVFVGNRRYTFNEGDYRIFRRNQLARYTKFPPPGGEYKSITVLLDQEILRTMGNDLKIDINEPYEGESVVNLRPNDLFKNYMESLKPYLNRTTQMNKMLTDLKVKEAIIILIETNPLLKKILFDFSEPGKIDLEAYMNEHYKFNVDLNRFAYLTGRSLATFKRDFEKIFHISPNRWLQQKRLNDAYYLIKEKGWKSSDVYLEVGFKDFSHFSFAFKKAFGVAPSLVSAV